MAIPTVDQIFKFLPSLPDYLPDSAHVYTGKYRSVWLGDDVRVLWGYKGYGWMSDTVLVEELKAEGRERKVNKFLFTFNSIGGSNQPLVYIQDLMPSLTLSKGMTFDEVREAIRAKALALFDSRHADDAPYVRQTLLQRLDASPQVVNQARVRPIDYRDLKVSGIDFELTSTWKEFSVTVPEIDTSGFIAAISGLTDIPKSLSTVVIEKLKIGTLAGVQQAIDYLAAYSRTGAVQDAVAAMRRALASYGPYSLIKPGGRNPMGPSSKLWNILNKDNNALSKVTWRTLGKWLTDHKIDFLGVPTDKSSFSLQGKPGTATGIVAAEHKMSSGPAFLFDKSLIDALPKVVPGMTTKGRSSSWEFSFLFPNRHTVNIGKMAALYWEGKQGPDTYYVPRTPETAQLFDVLFDAGLRFAPVTEEKSYPDPGDIVIRDAANGIFEVQAFKERAQRGMFILYKYEPAIIAISDTFRGERYLRVGREESVLAPDFTRKNIKLKGYTLLRKYIPSLYVGTLWYSYESGGTHFTRIYDMEKKAIAVTAKRKPMIKKKKHRRQDAYTRALKRFMKSKLYKNPANGEKISLWNFRVPMPKRTRKKLRKSKNGVNKLAFYVRMRVIFKQREAEFKAKWNKEQA